MEPRPRFQLRRQPADPSHSSTTTSVASNRTRRIRWTHDLHKRFVESVNSLGGAESENNAALVIINTDIPVH